MLRKSIMSLGMLLGLTLSATAQLYNVTDLGVILPTYDTSRATRLNATGEVTGTLSSVTDSRAFRWNGAMNAEPLPLLGLAAVGFDINNGGTIVGRAFLQDGFDLYFRAFTSNGATATVISPLDTGDYNSARGINNQGIIVGESNRQAGGSIFPFVYDPGQGTPLRAMPQLGGVDSFGKAISDGRWITGDAQGDFGAGFVTRAWRYDYNNYVNDTTPPLSPISVLNSSAGDSFLYWNQGNDVNDAGIVVGNSDITDPSGANPQTRGFFYNGTDLVDLGTISGADFDSRARGINNNNVIVGFSSDGIGDANRRAFILSYAGFTDLGGGNLISNAPMLDLNSLIDPNDPLFGIWTLLVAEDINDSGQIVGYMTNDGGITIHAFLLNPIAVPEPATLALAGLTLAGAGAAWYRRRQSKLLAQTAAATFEPDEAL